MCLKNKYIDVYTGYSISKYGDEIYETSRTSNSSTAWLSNQSGFITSSSDCMFRRSGDFGSGSGSGLFHFSRYSGNAWHYNSFRPTIVVY